MLNQWSGSPTLPSLGYPTAAVRTAHDAFSLGNLLRHRGLIVALSALGLVIGLLFAALRPPVFTSGARLLIENNVLQLSQQDVAITNAPIDTAAIQNQIELLTSEAMIIRVIGQLGLTGETDFSFRRMLQAWVGRAERTVSDEERKALLARRLQRDLSAFRRGTSHLVEVTFASRSPQAAAEFIGALLALHLQDQNEIKRSLSQLATPSLRDRVKGTGVSARIVSPPTLPMRPDGPGVGVIGIASALIGAVLGAALAFGRELLDKTIRTPNEAAKAVGANCFGVLPMVRSDRKRGRVAPSEGEFARLAYTLDHPTSPFSLTLERARLALEELAERKANVVVGISSCGAGEGKTVVAVNLARLLSRAGHGVLLVDGGSHNSQLTRLLAPDATIGMSQVASGSTPFAAGFIQDPLSNTVILPAVQSDAGPDLSRSANWLLRSPSFHEELSRGYRFVIVDMPPILPLPDVQEMAPALDGLILVCEWSVTRYPSLQEAIASTRIEDRVLGVLINKLEPGSGALPGAAAFAPSTASPAFGSRARMS